MVIADPVSVGIISNLARPEGNITGFASQNVDLEVKRLELLKDLLPRLARVGVLGNAANPFLDVVLKKLRPTAEQLRVVLELVTDLVGGQVQVAFDVMVTSLPHIRSGGLRALAVAGSQRFDMLPDVPTIAETLPGYEARTWIGVCAPAGTPVEIIKRLNREINAGLTTANIRARLSDVGTIPMILS